MIRSSRFDIVFYLDAFFVFDCVYGYYCIGVTLVVEGFFDLAS